MASNDSFLLEGYIKTYSEPNLVYFSEKLKAKLEMPNWHLKMHEERYE